MKDVVPQHDSNVLQHNMIHPVDDILLAELLRLRRKHLESCCAATQFIMPKHEAAQHDSHITQC